MKEKEYLMIGKERGGMNIPGVSPAWVVEVESMVGGELLRVISSEVRVAR
jgi:hypothetical protein